MAYSRAVFTAAVTVALSLAALPGLTYPIAPRTLWDLAAEAERVVLARVVVVSHGFALLVAFEDMETSVAQLRVLETWKGVTTRTVSVDFTPGFVCPAPDRYLEGETVLAFLESGESRTRGITDAQARKKLAKKWSGRWFTVALSYGTLYPDPEAVPAMRQLVAEALRLQSQGAVSDADRRQWLVRAAAEPATRWHGLYGLSRQSDAMHSFYDRREAPLDLVSSLTSVERWTLARAFCADPLLDQTVPMMLRVLAGHRDRAVDFTALAAIETALGDEPVPFWVHEAVPLVAARFGPGAPAERSTPAKMDGPDGDFTDDPLFRRMDRDDGDLRRLWAEARVRLGLPIAPRLPRSTQRVRAVGGDTPP
jgi:hypothetical protein